MDKNQAMIDFLNTCPAIRDNPLFFNFINAKEDNKQIITLANDKRFNNKTFVDGSVLRIYTLTLVDFKSITYQALAKVSGYANENVEEMFDVQSIMDWVNEQNTNHVFPDFGTKCVIESIETVTDNPNLNGTDTSTSPGTAKYSFSIRVTYLDKSNCLWED